MEIAVQYSALSLVVHQVFIDRLCSHPDCTSLNAIHHLGPQLDAASREGPLDFRVGARTIPPFEVVSLLALARRIDDGEEGEALQAALAEHFGLPPTLVPVEVMGRL
jgi:hypothetical protein